ncbi:Esterase [Planctomycetales bacterium 10988]|nr:Esterase [Planctomycetales bacterium 10988]
MVQQIRTLLVLSVIFSLSLTTMNEVWGQNRPPNSQQRWRQTQSRQQPRRNLEPSWQMPKVQGENLHYELFDSELAGEKVSYLIYLPPGYEEARDQRYPVVYWLHGIGGSQQGVPRMASRMTEAIRAGKLSPMIVVYVNGMIRSSYVDSKDGKMPVESVAIQELIPYIDANYRTIAKREGRMIEGFSMGGAGAAKWGLRHPEVFGSISIIDGALHSGDPTTGRRGQSFQSIYGGDRDYYEAHNPYKLVTKSAEQMKGRTPIRIVTGSRGLSTSNRQFHEHLRSHEIDCEFHVVEGAPHSPNPMYEGIGDKNWEFYQRAFNEVTIE